MAKEKNTLVRDNVLIGLFVGLILILLNWFNAHLPRTLSTDWIFFIDAMVIIILIIVFIKVRKK